MNTTEQKVIDIRKDNPQMRAANIARQLGISRELVRIYLKRNGLVTRFLPPHQNCPGCGIVISVHSKMCRPCRTKSTRVIVPCGACGKEVSILRSQFKYRQKIKRYSGSYYCNRECFYNRNADSRN